MHPEIAAKYEVVIGLEVHAQLATKSKLFCSDATSFGVAPNTQVSAITLAYPGTLPRTNRTAVDYAIKMGLACYCDIDQQSFFARKNYFYADLPKGYQISQHSAPICKGGFVTIKTNSYKREIKLNRIHLEEDAGKSIHDLEEGWSCIDLNRAGTPLIEIVTEPDLFSAEEAYQYVTEIRKLVRWLGICDGNMEEGSLRCDANISLRPKGEKKLGTKVEVKNLNSIRNVKKAIEFEVKRMAAALDAGDKIIQQTRSFDASNDTTFAIRDKEEANDYRYFPDPDLPIIQISEEHLNSLRESLPELPQALYEIFQTRYGLSDYDASQLTDDKSIADYYKELIKHTSSYKSAANWLLGPIKQYLNEINTTINAANISVTDLATLIELVETGKLNFSIAASKVFPELVKGKEDALRIAEQLGLLQVSNTDELTKWVDETIASMPEKVIEYKKGKKGLMGLFVGDIKKRSKGKADPKLVTQILEEKLK
ncbi:MAG: Asp-tRNA(Asn)/Glu-tRNA(Gln) amidotransferase subunit GatB [Chitinophagaceae bacterium]|nr:Asp-tRNA(Asn)/Glu-tRNA(Gln) amidotransferase subunit GatB [Chitinophagaceae bacterium]MCA6448203.1 Asp-tRNA(Asn)/Glu-tRNA(Gln) amidotransferase subunit GatB [Chitinophagaceae bacterium]